MSYDNVQSMWKQLMTKSDNDCKEGKLSQGDGCVCFWNEMGFGGSEIALKIFLVFSLSRNHKKHCLVSLSLVT